jgi:hypothetical protein
MEYNLVEDLINSFPESDKVKKEDFSDIIKHIFNEMKSYREIWGYLSDALENIYPSPSNEMWEEHWQKGGNDYCAKYKEYKDRFIHYVNNITKTFVAIKGKRHTYEDACSIAADEWVDLIFGSQLQDNGDRSEHSGMAMMLGTLLKYNAQERIPNFKELKPIVREKFYDYYHNGCLCNYEGRTVFCTPDCDYHPNIALCEILKESGIPEKEIDSICPWKTSIRIDNEDYTVIIYKQEECIYK